MCACFFFCASFSNTSILVLCFVFLVSPVSMFLCCPLYIICLFLSTLLCPAPPHRLARSLNIDQARQRSGDQSSAMGGDVWDEEDDPDEYHTFGDVELSVHHISPPPEMEVTVNRRCVWNTKDCVRGGGGLVFMKPSPYPLTVFAQYPFVKRRGRAMCLVFVGGAAAAATEGDEGGRHVLF